MFKVLGLPKVKKTLQFMFFAAVSSPNWEVFVAYSNEEQYHITPLFEGGMITISFIMSAIWLILYNSTFSNARTRWFTIKAVFMRAVGVGLFASMVEVDQRTEVVKIIFAVNALIVQPIVAAYLQKPASMLFAKCIPHSIEGMMIGMVNSIVTITSEILMRLIAVACCLKLNNHEGLTIENYTGLSQVMNKTLIISLIVPLILVKHLVDRN
jgi:hypothetical protein